MVVSSLLHEIIQYLLTAFLLYHILISYPTSFSVSKSTEARLMVSDFCWICLLNMSTPLIWMHKRCFAIKIVCFANGIRSIHQSISCAFEFTNFPSTIVISIGIASTYFIANETNLFKLSCVPNAWTSSGCALDLGLNKDAPDEIDVDAATASAPGLSALLSFFSLLIECLPNTRKTIPAAVLLAEDYFSIIILMINW